jgi:signal peptidase II
VADISGEATQRPKTTVLVAITAVVILLIDQVTKVWAVAKLENAPPIDVISGVFQFTFVRNPGAAFSLGAGSTMLVSLIAVAIVVVLMFRARNLRSVWWAIAMGGMIGGALGNLTDRVFRDPGGLRGHVVDFLALPFWPVFNVADMAVVGAAILMMVLALLGIDFDGTRHVDAKSADGDEAPSDASGSAPGASGSAPGASGSAPGASGSAPGASA